MQNHIPTIQELKGKSERELRSIFRAAVEASRSSPLAAQRLVALKTAEVVQLVLPLPSLH